MPRVEACVLCGTDFERAVGSGPACAACRDVLAWKAPAPQQARPRWEPPPEAPGAAWREWLGEDGPWGTVTVLGIFSLVAAPFALASGIGAGIAVVAGLVGLYSPLVALVLGFDLWRFHDHLRREAAKRGARRSAQPRVFPPRGTRCALCRCDFLVLEAGLRCRGCQTLLHQECGEDLRRHDRRCPTLGCPVA